jgi:hypothetical protein
VSELAGACLFLFCLLLPILYPSSIIFSFIWAAVQVARG